MKKVLNFLKSILLGKYCALIFAIIAAIDVIINYSYRVGYIFVDGSLFNGFSMTLFILTIISALYLTGVAALNLKKSDTADKKAIHIFQIIAEIFAIIIGIYNIVNMIVGKSESFSAAVGLFWKAFPVWFACVCVSFALFIIPNISKVAVKKTLSAVLSVIMLFYNLCINIPYCTV